MQNIFKLPPEITTRIFQSCDSFPQALALAATCKHFSSQWIANSPAAIWAIGSRNIIAFDDALMAVRATAIVLEAHQAGRQPPPFTSMRVLSGRYQRPTLTEFKELLNMQHLVRCLEFMFFNCLITPVWDLFGMEMLKSKYRRQPTPEERDGWQRRFYGAMYRMLLAGAVVSGAYLQPFFEAIEYGDGELKRKDGFLNRCQTAHGSDLGPANLEEDDIEYLRRYSVFNFDVLDDSEIGKWRNEQYERTFGPFASWLVEDGKSRGVQKGRSGDNFSDESLNDAAQQGAVQELMCLLVAYEHLCCNITNADGKDHSGRLRWEYVDQGIITRGKPRTVSVILFGVFQVEEISMPVQIEDTASMLLPAQQHPKLQYRAAETGGLLTNRPDISRVLHTLYSVEHTRSEYHKGGDSDPIPTLELWHFALRHYLNLGFEEDAFHMWTECMWWLYVGTGAVFADPTCAIVESYVPGRVSWHSRSAG